MKKALAAKLRRLAAEYETPSFMDCDPSFAMHLFEDPLDAEAAAFAAASLSYGARKAFIPKIEFLLGKARDAGGPDRWIRSGAAERFFAGEGAKPFYRFYTHGDMAALFRAWRRVMEGFGSLGGLVRAKAEGDGKKAVAAICEAFAANGCAKAVPRDASSACKRICMFLRWMARGDSCVDLGLWAGFLDKSTLPMPLDVHVLRQARRLGLMGTRAPSMRAALELSHVLSEVFPGDPCKGDFALFGLGVAGADGSPPPGFSAGRA